VLHKGESELGQRVTRLEGKLFCDCHVFVERVVQCQHICAVVEHEAMPTAQGDKNKIKSTIHWAMRKQLKDQVKRGRPPGSFRRRHLAEGTRVLVKTSEAESQVAVIVGNTRESCDVKLGESAAPRRVPARDIVDWLMPGKRQQERGLGTIVPLSKVKSKSQKRPRKEAKLVWPPSESPEATPPAELEHDGPAPMGFRWSLFTPEVKITNTCPYDAVLAVLMHIPANDTSIQAFIRSRMEHDVQLQELDRIHALFWSDSVTEVSAF
jgi:hypothetical protein